MLLHGWAVMNGGIYLSGVVQQPRSVSVTLPTWLQFGWFGLLLAGGLVGLAAAWLQGRNGRVENGLRVEAGALCFLSGGALIYTTVLFATNGMLAFGSGTLVGTYGLAGLIRILHIRRDLGQLP